MLIIDANGILRYLLDDNAEMADKVEEIIKSREFFVPNEIFVEVVYVMLKVYKVDRREIRDILLRFIEENEYLEVTDIDMLKKAINSFAEDNIDFVDGLLIGYKQVLGYEILTFDKRLNNLLK